MPIPKQPELSDILKAGNQPPGEVIGSSRAGKKLLAYHFGEGSLNVSLIGGCHADEPTGPIFLNHLVSYLSNLKSDAPLLREISWWIVPHVNPDGAETNSLWYHHNDHQFDLVKNLKFSIRELPGDDVEFGFPLTPNIPALRPENQAVYDFWKRTPAGFDLHVSLHGMLTAYGPWFLLDKDFVAYSADMIHNCQQKVLQMGYQLHDVDRKGEKGFFRLAEGFGSRPDSKAMRDYFLALNDAQMASKFHASSMESIRSLGDNCLTLVTEMPLFIVPRISHNLEWPDQTLNSWSQQFQHWKLLLEKDQLTPSQLKREAAAKGLVAMPVQDQMYLQWFYIWSGIEQCLRKDRGD
ncbi:MAG: M14 family zinc carboxypeptidase [Cyclobacteriaceae bacterium]|nr:M14 family zinc carboxypeptidase [Cyclobacteriaceae bacterium]